MRGSQILAVESPISAVPPPVATRRPSGLNAAQFNEDWCSRKTTGWLARMSQSFTARSEPPEARTRPPARNATLVAKVNEPPVKYALVGAGALVVVLVLRKIFS